MNIVYFGMKANVIVLVCIIVCITYSSLTFSVCIHLQKMCYRLVVANLSHLWALSNQIISKKNLYSAIYSTDSEALGRRIKWGRHNDTDKFLSVFLPVRRYASAGNSDRNVSVRLSVRLSRAGIVLKRRKLAAWFLHHLVAPRL